MSIRLDGLPKARAGDVIEGAFAEVESVHRLMSFHEDGSDVSRLNREAFQRPVQVHRFTYEVVQRAQAVSDASNGVFDIAVAGRLVNWGILPAPNSALPPDAGGSWRDIELGRDRTLRFHRPLWIDLGGIAKGYAVDRAIEAMASSRPAQCVVNAGGDLRVAGGAQERVLLDAERGPDAAVPVLEIENASLASSSGVHDRRRHGHRAAGPHVDGRTGAVVGTHSFASVLAPTCVVADALTKVVLAMRQRAAPVLRHFGAAAYWHDASVGWRAIGCGPAVAEQCQR